MDIPASHLAVLEAMTRPEPKEPEWLDCPGAAIHRRVPEVAADDAAEILHNLNVLGFTNVPYTRGTTTAANLATLRRWITEKGWEALGMGATTTRPS